MVLVSFASVGRSGSCAGLTYCDRRRQGPLQRRRLGCRSRSRGGAPQPRCADRCLSCGRRFPPGIPMSPATCRKVRFYGGCGPVLPVSDFCATAPTPIKREPLLQGERARNDVGVGREATSGAQNPAKRSNGFSLAAARLSTRDEALELASARLARSMTRWRPLERCEHPTIGSTATANARAICCGSRWARRSCVGSEAVQRCASVRPSNEGDDRPRSSGASPRRRG